jgi:serine/threonine-protein kinase HipA
MNKLQVFLDFRNRSYKAGELFLSEKLGRYVFNYDPAFLFSGLELSPFTIPLGNKTFIAERNKDMYNLHSPFADALPDEWGRIVQDAEFEKIGKFDVSAIERLSFIGSYGMGALKFKPEQTFSAGLQAVEIADLRKATQRIITGNIDNIVEQLFRAGGSAGGASPKYLVDLKNNTSNTIRYTTGELEEDWIPIILKVSGNNGDHWQRIEYCYFKMAELAGINVPSTQLLIEDNGNAHFAINRFDINKSGERYHTQTFAGLMGVNFRDAVLDYTSLFRTTADLCRDMEQVKEIYRRMVFNYLGGNKDDHAKNFSFLMDSSGKWNISPAYDLAYSSGEQGLHAMAAAGKRRNLSLNDFQKIADDFDIKDWRVIVDKIKEALGNWQEISEKYGVPEKSIKNIRERVTESINRTK